MRARRPRPVKKRRPDSGRRKTRGSRMSGVSSRAAAVPTTGRSTEKASQVRLLVVLLVIVCAAVAGTHWPALSALALSFVDTHYITENPLVQIPFLGSAKRFLTEVLEPSTVKGYYQPLSMISLMVDWALGGRADNLRPFHRTSLILHTANTALLIVLLYSLFGSVWAAAGAGLLFGVHPMTVEPIPWVGERKTLLAAFFAFCCLVVYVGYARRGGFKLYLGCMALYVLSLLSKPTGTLLPVGMLVMDYWPLKRWKRGVVLEKAPFFIICVVSAIITYISQSRTLAAKMPTEFGPARVPLILCHNIVFYLYKIVWPVRLSSHYAFPQPLALSETMVLAGVIGTCILIAGLIVSLRWTRAAFAGWFFFFLTILPTMQIVGFSDVIASDKFAYMPSAGLLMVVVSSVLLLAGSKGARHFVSRSAAVCAIILISAGAEMMATRRYLVHWRDTVTFTKHMLSLTPNVAPMHNHLAIALGAEGKLDEAIRHYRRAIEIRPGYSKAYNNLGGLLARQRKFDEAVKCFHRALESEPDFVEAYVNLAAVFKAQGNVEDAVGHLETALRINPRCAEAHNHLGSILADKGKFDEAAAQFRLALAVGPRSVRFLNNLGSALAAQGKYDQAVGYFRRALEVEPGDRDSRVNLQRALRLRAGRRPKTGQE